MMQRKLLFSLGVLFILLFMASCNETSSRSALPTQDVQVAKAYPGVSNSNAGTTKGYPVTGENEAAPTPGELLKPEAGMTSINGSLFSQSISQPLPKTLFYLTPAVGEQKEAPKVLVGPLEEKGDIKGVSDDKGVFSLNNIPPGDYYLVVVFPNEITIAQTKKEGVSPLLITLKADQQLPLGQLFVP